LAELFGDRSTGLQPFPRSGAWTSAGPTRAAVGSTWSTRRRPETTGAAAAHCLELILLLRRQDLVEPGVDFFLKRGDQGLLVVGQPEPILKSHGEDLAGLGRPAHPSAAGTERAAARPTWPAGRTAAAAGPEVGSLFGKEGRQLVPRHLAVLVGVGPVEQSLEPWIGHLVSYQLAILVVVEPHQPRDEAGGGGGRWPVAPSATWRRLGGD
jgi:hypothetical protein